MESKLIAIDESTTIKDLINIMRRHNVVTIENFNIIPVTVGGVINGKEKIVFNCRFK